MATRRQFLLRSTMAIAGSRFLPAQAPRNVIRKVSEGALQGEALTGCDVYRGVPFAEPPVGALRFRPPVPHRRWSGVRDATKFAPAAMQPGNLHFPQSEDCLYLNLWAPQGPGPYPVFVWIHGGGFTGGWPTEPLYDGTLFAQSGIVCISIAYRLGAFGFLDVSNFLGPEFSGSADTALLDIIAALQWIQTNIAAFGGDPDRVTIGGESAGAKLTDILMGIPQAEPLFHQMISESGGADRISDESGAATVSAGFAETWKSNTGLPASAMRTAPAEQIIAVQKSFMQSWPRHFPLRPELNRELIPSYPLKTIRSGSTRSKRLLIGTNHDESALFLGPDPTHEVTSANLGNMPLAQFLPIEADYRRIYPDLSAERRRILAVSAEEYWVPSLRVAEAHVAHGGEAFVYRLDFPGSGRFAGLAFHSLDLRFVWEHFGASPITPAEQALATTMHAAWVSFIKGKSPTAPGLPAWTRYNTTTRPTMIFDHDSHIDLDPSATERKLWDGLLAD